MMADHVHYNALLIWVAGATAAAKHRQQHSQPCTWALTSDKHACMHACLRVALLSSCMQHASWHLIQCKGDSRPV
jgi:hypothetical protein